MIRNRKNGDKKKKMSTVETKLQRKKKECQEGKRVSDKRERKCEEGKKHQKIIMVK